MPVVLGLLAAAVWGAADFLGGIASRRSLAGSVVVVSGLTGVVLAVGIVAIEGAQPAGRDLLLGAGAGLVGTAGVTFLYAGLGIARMGLVAPLSALVAATLPVAWGISRGERPSGLAITGVALAVAAVILITREPATPELEAPPSRRGILYGLLSGVGFGFVFILFSEVDASSGMWPLLSARAASVPLLAAGLALARRPVLPRRADAPTAAAAGGLDLLANALFVVAAHEGLTSVVSPVASLYPAGTVLLAAVVLGERLHRHQLVGVGVALVGLAFLGAG